MSVQFFQSPIGALVLQEEGEKLVRVAFLFGRKPTAKEQLPKELANREGASIDAFSEQELALLAKERYRDVLQSTEVLEQARQEILEYFAGERKEFHVPIDPRGTAFQRLAWEALAKVPYGCVKTYGELAKAIGSPKSARAIGAAMRVNPIGIVLPCHRIVGASGKLTGYNGGLDRKSFLLQLEANALKNLRMF